MQCREYNVNQAAGVRIFNAVSLGDRLLPVGHVLTDEDVIALKAAGINRIFGAEMESGDITAPTALGMIAAKLCGDGTAYIVSSENLCRIVADRDGIFMASSDRLAKFNRLGDIFRLNSREPYSLVKSGEIIAELETTYAVIEAAKTDEIIFSLSGNTEMFSVTEAIARKTALIYADFYGNAAETKHFTSNVRALVKNFSAMNLDFKNEYNARHEIESLADNIQRAVGDGNEVIFILPGQRSSHPRDIVPAAMNRFVDEIVNYDIPQVGASDLLIASKRGSKIIALPYAYAENSSALADMFIRQAIVSEKLNHFDFSHPQNVLLPENRELSEEEKGGLIGGGSSDSQETARVAAVILAAGSGARAGRNKLMLEVDGEPLFMKAVHAAIKSRAAPVFVVTGYNAPELENYLENIDVNIIYNANYHDGVKSSINLGLKSVPGFCDGALLIPADMPNLTAETLDKMIAAFPRGRKKHLGLLAYDGIKYNPSLWSKELYGVADIVPENAHLRAVFVEHSDYTKETKIKDAKLIADVNFPSDIEKLLQKK